MDAQREAYWRWEWVEAVRHRGRGQSIREALDEHATRTLQEAPNRTTVYGWLDRAENYGIIGLLDAPRSDCGSRRAFLALPPRVRAAVGDLDEFIAEHVAGSRDGAAAVLHSLQRLSGRRPLRIGYSTVSRWVREWTTRNQHLVYVAKRGVGGFRDDMRLWLGWSPVAPLSMWMLDSTPADESVVVTDPLAAGGTRLVRPYLTTLEDVGSRAVLSFEVTVGPLCADAVLGVLRRALVMGENWEGLASVPVLPSAIRLDNGAEHQGVVADALTRLGLRTPVLPGQPEARSHVERLHRTINAAASAGAPGRITRHKTSAADAAASDAARGRIARAASWYAPPIPQSAHRTLEEYVRAVHACVLAYNDRPHRGIKRGLRAEADAAVSSAA